jgi:hypothetical protein
MTERGAVAKGGVPKLSSVVANSESFGVPRGAEQKGTTSLLDAGDDRMQQVQSIGGAVWGQLDTAVTIPGDAAQRDGAAWFQVKPHVSKGTVTGASIPRQGYVVVPGDYLLDPALQLTPSGTAAMVMTMTGRSRFPSAAYALLAPGASSFGPVTVAASGTTNYDPSGERWGDYSWAVMDPVGTSVWLASEYVPPKSSQTVDGRGGWGTRVFKVPTG